MSGDTFAAMVSASQVSVSGLAGVSVASVNRDSNTQLSVTLAFDGTDFDVDGELTFTVLAAAISGSSVDLSATLVVEADLYLRTVTSPDGSLTATVKAAAGELSYSVSRDGNELIAESPLSIVDSVDHTFTGSAITSGDSTWEPTWGLYSIIRDHHNRLTLNLDVDGTAFDLIFQVYDDGLGFRFVADEQASLTGETVDFNVRYNLDASFMARWPGGEGSPHGPFAIDSLPTVPKVPMVINAGTSGYFALLESDLFSAEAFESNIIFEVVTGEPAVQSDAQSSAVPAGDFVSPWRVVLVGDEPGDLLESTVPVNLAAPLALSDASWIKPGKALFNWRTLGYTTDDGTFTYTYGSDSLERLIDFVAEHEGLNYVQIDDGWWELIQNGQIVTQATDFDIEDVMAYAAAKGVGMIIYIDRLPSSKVVNTTDEQLYQLIDGLGAVAMKYGFRGRDVPFTRKALRNTAAKEIVINFHDGPVPLTGVRRTMPNAITRQTGWGQQDDREAFQPTDYLEMAFINALLGPFDQINGIYDIYRMRDRNNGARNPIHSTIASENARVFTTFSGMVMLPDVPEEYAKKPEMLEFILEMPTTWDDTRILHGSIPNYITTARRSGDAWFVCSVTNESARTLGIDLDFLDANVTYDVTYYEDDHDGANPTHYITNRETYQVRTGTVVSTDSVDAIMVDGGGHCMWIRPQELGASSATALTEDNLDGAVVTLTLPGAADAFATTVSASQVSVSGIAGVSIASVNRDSSTQLSVTLAFDGDFDVDSRLTFTVLAAAISSASADASSVWLLVTAVVEAPAAPAPIAHWPMDNDADDAVGTSDGTLQGGVGFVANASGEGVGSHTLSLDGTNDHVNLTSHASNFPLDDSARSISGWFNAGSASTQGASFFAYGATGSGQRFSIVADRDEASVSVQGGTWGKRNLGLSAGWHHIAVTYAAGGDSESFSIYVDGVLQSSSSLSGQTRAIYTQSTVAYIGRSVGTGTTLYYDGDIDDVRLYDYQLSAAQVQYLLENPTVPSLAASGTLTETDLDGSVVTLTLSDADNEFAAVVASSQVTVAGLAGVSVSSVTRDSNTQLSVTLAFDGTDFDVDRELTLTVVAALSGSSTDLAVTLAVTAAVETPPPPPAPIAHWPMNNDADDAEGTSDGTLQGDAGFVANASEEGLGSHALSLDGTGDYVDLSSHASSFLLGDSARSFTAWFNADSASTQGESLFAYGANGTGQRFSITADRDEASVSVQGTRWGDAFLNLSAGWHHIAVTYPARGHSKSFSIYVDGVLQASRGQHGQIKAVNTGSDVAYIGRSAGTGTAIYYEGDIDDVRLYDYQLSTAQVLHLFDNPTGSSLAVSGTLTEANLDGAVVTLTLKNDSFAGTVAASQVSVSGLSGVSVASVNRKSNRRLRVTLAFDGTDFDVDGELTFTVAAAALNRARNPLSLAVPVAAVVEPTLQASGTLTEADLDGAVVTLTVSGATITALVSALQVTVSGLNGVRVASVARGGTQLVVTLAFDGTDFDVDGELTFTVVAAVINGWAADLSATLAVTTEVTLVASGTLNEADLNGAVVTLAVSGVEFAAMVSASQVSVSGLSGVSVAAVNRNSNRRLSVTLAFDGSDFDVDGELTFTVAVAALSGSSTDLAAAGLAVTAVVEVTLLASGALTEDSLDGAVVTLTLINHTFAATVPASQVTVAGLAGVSVASVNRDSNTQLSVTLAFDGSDFDVDAQLAFTVAAAAVTSSSADLSSAGLAVSAVVEAGAPISHWPMDNDADDAVGTSHGRLQGNPRFVTNASGEGVGSHALSLDGDGDFVDLNLHVSKFPLGDSARSISGWFNAGSASTQRASFFVYGSGGNGRLLAITADRAVASVGVGGHVWGVGLSLNAGWHHIAVTYPAGGDSESFSIYVDGVLQAPGTLSGSVQTIDTGSIAAYIGQSVGLHHYEGEIDDLHLYDFELSAAQVQNLFAHPAGSPLAASGTLSEADLNGAVATLRLSGDTFAAMVSASQVSVSGLAGVSVSSVNRINNRRLGVTLAFDGTDFDVDGELTFTVLAAAISGSSVDLSATLVVEADLYLRTVTSPDGSLTATVKAAAGELSYSVSRDGNELIAESPLSIVDSVDHTFTGSAITSGDSTWEPTWGMYSSIRDHHNRLTLNLDVDGTAFDLIFQVYDDGLGFRFVADEQASLTGETVDFNVRYNLDASFMARWPNREHSPKGPYAMDSLSGSPSTPMVIEAGTQGYLALLESDLFSAEAFTSIKFQRVAGEPAVTSNNQSDAVPASDFVTPWRVILVGDEPGDLLESSIVVNLAAPLALADPSWIKPGKALFNWRTLGYTTDDGTFTYTYGVDSLKRLIDFVAEQGLDYVQIDDNWWVLIENGQIVTQATDFDIEDVMAYAATKGVDMVIYVDRLPDNRVVNTTDEQIYQLFSDLGGKSVKYGFEGNRAPFTRDAIRGTAAREMMINFHDNPTPMTGVRRTMPNAITRQTGWGQQDGLRAFEPTDYLEMAFVNALLGPFDQINGVYDINNMPNRDNGSLNPISTTIASENARILTTFSGMVMLPDVPEEYLKKADMFEFIQEMPTTWDDTRILHGSIPNYITTARRSGDAWFVCSVTNESARTLGIDLDFLDANVTYDVTYYEDDHDGIVPTHYASNRETYQVRSGSVTASDSVDAIMVAGGGHCMWIRPQELAAAGTLTEDTINGAVVTLTLVDHMFAGTVTASHVSVSGVAGVGVASVNRDSSTQLSVTLAFDGSDFDVDGELKFRVVASKVIGSSTAVSSVGLPVTAVFESGAPVARWRMNNNANDAVGANHGTLQGDAGFVANAAVGNRALRLDGNGDYVDLSSHVSNFPLGSSARSITGWFDANSASTQGQSFFAYGKDMVGRRFSITADRDEASVSVSGHLWGKQNLNLNSGWHHIAVTYPAGGDSESISIYVDGVLQTLSTLIGSVRTVNTGSDVAYIGQSAGSQTDHYGGDIDDVRLYDYQLDADQVRGLFQGGGSSLLASGELTETYLDGAIVTLTLIDYSFAATVAASRVSVSGIDGVSVASVSRGNDAQLGVTLAFDGSDFDVDGELTFTVVAAALTGSSAAVSSAGLAVTAVIEQSTPPAPIAYWPMNDDVKDAVGNSNGTLQGDAEFTRSAKLGSHALSLDGNGDYVDLTHRVSNFPQGSSARSITGWFDADSGSQGATFFAYGTDSTGRRISITADRDEASVGVSGHLWGVDSLGLSSGWHHVAVTYPAGGDSESFSIYVDGVRQAPGDLAGGVQTVNTGSSVAYIGQSAGSQTDHYDGDIDDVRLYDYQLDAAQVQQLFGDDGLKVLALGTLTEADLDGAVVRLKLVGNSFSETIVAPRVRVNGIAGVSVASVNRDSSTQLSVILAFDGTDFDVDGELTFTVAAAALHRARDPLSVTLPVEAVVEPLAAAGTLTEDNLDGADVTLTLVDHSFAGTVTASHVSVSGITGVSIASVNRDSNTQLSVILAFDGTDFDVDGELTFTVVASKIIGSSVDLSATLAVTAVVEPPMAASGTLTEDNLDGAVVTLAVSGVEFAAMVSASQVSVSGLSGVSVASVNRDSSTQLSVTLAFDGTDFDVDGELTFTVVAAAITGSSVSLSAALPVEAGLYLVTSPDGSLAAAVKVAAGELSYWVSRDGNVLIAESPLSIVDSVDHTFTGSAITNHDSTWEPTWGLYSSIRDHHNRLTLNLDVDGTAFDLIFQVYDDGLGFRFVADEQASLTGETVDFNVRYNLDASFMARWPGGEGSPYGPFAIDSLPTDPKVPMVINAGTSGYFALLESDLFSAEAFESNIIFEAVTGEPAVQSDVQSSAVPASDFVSPWRVVLVGDEPGDLLESTVPVNLAAPLALSDASWIKPGKALFNWRTLGYTTDDGTFTYTYGSDSLERLIDFVAEHEGLNYVQIDDGWWELIENGQIVTQATDFDIEDVMAYAAAKGVGMIIYIDRLPSSKVVNTTDEQLYQLIDGLGAVAMKYGFRGRDVPFTRKALRNTAAKEIVINFHDGPVPLTGVRRTMPNAITRQTGWGQQDDREAFQPTDYLEMAFINALLGPFDQINGIYDIYRIRDRNNGARNPIHSTIASENARVFTTFSGMVMLPDVPEEYAKKAEMFEFIRKMPTTWDDTRILHGSIPNYITTARRSGDAWFVCSVTNESARTLGIDLDFLDANVTYDVTYYEDDHDGANPTHYITNRETYQVRTGTVVSTDSVDAIMVDGGGHCMWIRPQELGASSATALTEDDLDGAVVTLTLPGAADAFAATVLRFAGERERYSRGEYRIGEPRQQHAAERDPGV